MRTGIFTPAPTKATIRWKIFSGSSTNATGPPRSAEEFSRKAQLAHYEDVRAQYETYATHWANRKMMIHWMMNNPWPSFFGHLFDDYFKQGGGYFGAKKGLRP